MRKGKQPEVPKYAASSPGESSAASTTSPASSAATAPVIPTSDFGYPPSSASPDTAGASAPMQFEYEQVMSFDDASSPYAAPAAGSSSVARKKKSIKSESSIELRGPMEVDGSVKSMGAITFNGDFTVRERIEAYGNIEINGNLTCQNKLKSFGNLKINGEALCTDKVKIFGKLKITGHFEVQSEIEVWGTVTINGYMRCRSLTAYSSITAIGDHSGYEVEESETVHGAKLVQRDDYEG